MILKSEGTFILELDHFIQGLKFELFFATFLMPGFLLINLVSSVHAAVSVSYEVSR